MTTLTQAALVLLLQSTGLLLLGLGALRVTRGRGPAVQTLVGRASLVSVALLLLLLPLTGHVPPVVRVPEPTPVRSSPTLPKREGEEVQTVNGTVGAPLAAPSDITALSPLAAPFPQNGQTRTEGQIRKEEGQTRGSAPTLRPPAPGGTLRSNLLRSKEVGSLWLAVSLTLLLWLGLCQRHLTRLRRTAQPITSGSAVTLLAELTPNPPLLLTHLTVHSPFLAGYRHPVIFLPTTYAADFDADALRAIFVHELAHLARRDNFWTLAARLLTALLWPQPLLWLLVRRLEHISEDACDEAVLARNCPPRAYADCLLSLATRPPLTPRQRTLNAGVAPFRSSVGRRISRILTIQGDRPMSPITLHLRLTAAALTVAAAIGGTLLISSAPAQTAAPAQTTAPAPPTAATSDTSLAEARFLAGLTPVQGPGVVVTLTDSKKPFPAPMPVGVTPPNTIHDSDINQVVNELKAAGAEAVAVNGQRLVATSSIRSAGPTVFINSVPQAPPFVINAIGDPKALASALNLPGGIASIFKNFDPAMFSIRQAQTLTLPAYSGSSEPRYAKPVSAGAAGIIRPQQLAALFAQRNQLQYEKSAQPMIRYQRTFDDELRQALPQSEAQTLAKARNLEFDLGRDQADLGDMKALLRRSHKPQARQLVQKMVAEEETVAALRAKEAALFPATLQARQHLAQVHALALHRPTKTLKIQVLASEIAMLNDQIQQMSSSGASSATAAN